MIFLTITGSFTGAVFYDKYQKKRIQQKWCDLVRPASEELLPPTHLPRKITIYVSGPPGDSLRIAREHFYEYVKPVLVAGALDWEVVEGRREGDIRYGAAERIRRRRRRAEGIRTDEDDEAGLKEELILDHRDRAGTIEWTGAGGDLIVGRNTWKEYVRGVHEGWLGPLQAPREAETPAAQVSAETSRTETEKSNDGHAHSTLGDAAVEAATNITQGQTATGDSAAASDSSSATPTDDASPQAEKKPEEEKSKPKLLKPAPYISTSAYNTASTPSSMPQTLDPAVIVPFPHILGFLNTPIRVARFLNRRQLADDIGRQTAALVMAEQHRSFRESMLTEDGDSVPEQELVLKEAEKEWPKSVRNRERKDGEESVWLDNVVVDQRIGERMKLWELRRIDEARAQELLEKGGREQKAQDSDA